VQVIAKIEALLDECIELAREARAYLRRCAPIDWTLLYGPRGTEIQRQSPQCLHPRAISDSGGLRCAECGMSLTASSVTITAGAPK
jgi:hypothetical protein